MGIVYDETIGNEVMVFFHSQIVGIRDSPGFDGNHTVPEQIGIGEIAQAPRTQKSRQTGNGGSSEATLGGRTQPLKFLHAYTRTLFQCFPGQAEPSAFGGHPSADFGRHGVLTGHAGSDGSQSPAQGCKLGFPPHDMGRDTLDKDFQHRFPKQPYGKPRTQTTPILELFGFDPTDDPKAQQQILHPVGQWARGCGIERGHGPRFAGDIAISRPQTSEEQGKIGIAQLEHGGWDMLFRGLAAE